MNIYVVVEGEKAAKKIYKTWISLVNPDLEHIDYIKDIAQNNFFILAGFGQPQFLNRIEQAVMDVNRLSFDRLVIAVDSEDMNFHEKQLEVSERVDKTGCNVEVRYIIQHFCLETWLLGNKNMFRRKTQDRELLNYRALFDVRNGDPELLPPHIANSWNRAKFAFHYLRAGLRDVHPGNRVSYSKKNPGIVAKEGYFKQVRKRCLDQNHILSFHGFLEAFV